MQEISDFYLHTETNIPRDYKFYLDKYTELHSDILFVEPVLIEANLKASLGWPVYVYENIYYNPTMFPPDFPVKGLPFLFFIFHIIYYGKVWFLFDCDTNSTKKTQLKFSKNLGAYHTIELPFLIGSIPKIPAKIWTNEDSLFRNSLLSAIINFIKTL